MPITIEETGLRKGFLNDLAIKTLYTEGDLLGYELAEHMRLPHPGVIERVLESLKHDRFCEVKGTGGFGGAAGFGGATYRYTITDKGRAMARECLARSQYVGPAPVTLAYYSKAVGRQPLGELTVHRRALHQALSHLVVDDDTAARLGAAVNSRRSIFLFGPPGNGKTAIAESIGDLVLSKAMYIPYAIEAGGQVIKVFDNVNHVVDESRPSGNAGNEIDPRWIRVRRPVIIVGGELTLEELDLVYDDTNKFYEAPFQMKANGGMLLIDDFGRQQVRPRNLLNRWIVPLEKRRDYLTLHTGRKIQVPFDVLIVFSTNMAPSDLVDEAFLRRIRHKIEIQDPSWQEYREIFRRVCREKQVPYDEQGLAYLIKEHYIKRDRPKRGCHPRDLIDQLIDIARYLNVQPKLSKELVDHACETYFVDLWSDDSD